MDDSVIKVLRRNGSWEKSNKKQDTTNYVRKDLAKFKTHEDNYELDEKFEILAKEIKKRMNSRGINKVKTTEFVKSNSRTDENEYISKTGLEDIGKLKSQILPYLKTIEKLIIRKQNYSDAISQVDKELDAIHDDITKIKNNYLNTINNLKNNMNFFDDSLDIIKNAKGEK